MGATRHQQVHLRLFCHQCGGVAHGKHEGRLSGEERLASADRHVLPVLVVAGAQVEFHAGFPAVLDFCVVLALDQEARGLWIKVCHVGEGVEHLQPLWHSLRLNIIHRTACGILHSLKQRCKLVTENAANQAFKLHEPEPDYRVVEHGTFFRTAFLHQHFRRQVHVISRQHQLLAGSVVDGVEFLGKGFHSCPLNDTSSNVLAQDSEVLLLFHCTTKAHVVLGHLDSRRLDLRKQHHPLHQRRFRLRSFRNEDQGCSKLCAVD